MGDRGNERLRVDSGSKIAMGAISCFFPSVISTASAMRQINCVLVRFGRSFPATTWQMIGKIYLPAMRPPVATGARLGLGLAFIGTLLAETKLSNRGIGYLIIQAYATFDMPRMYALLIVLLSSLPAPMRWSAGRPKTHRAGARSRSWRRPADPRGAGRTRES